MPPITPEMRELMEETQAMLARGQMVPERIEPWWEERRPGELTPEYLGRVLDEAGLHEMAARARLGHFDDFHAPAEVADGFELIRMVAELRSVARERPGLAERLAVIENAARRGEFDATKAESDRWAASKDGQETFRMLVSSAFSTCPRCGTEHATVTTRCGCGYVAPKPPAPKVGRNEPCPCGSGLKWKRCHGAR